jgi:hypothetical protein
MANGGTDPATRVGACQGYKCACKAYDQVKTDRTWPTCRCRHVQQTHSNPEPEAVASGPAEQA